MHAVTTPRPLAVLAWKGPQWLGEQGGDDTGVRKKGKEGRERVEGKTRLDTEDRERESYGKNYRDNLFNCCLQYLLFYLQTQSRLCLRSTD